MPKGHYPHKKRGTKEAAILDAATRVYAHFGFEGATLQKMADEAGVTPGLIIQYFGSKQGLVRAVVDRAVAQSLARLAEIDQTPGITLRQRAQKQLAQLLPAREQWCLILGTLLVPSFQFAMRGQLAAYLNTEYQHNLAHMEEFINPTPESVYAYTYADISLRLGLITGGDPQGFVAAQAVQQALYLLPG